MAQIELDYFDHIDLVTVRPDAQYHEDSRTTVEAARLKVEEGCVTLGLEPVTIAELEGLHEGMDLADAWGWMAANLGLTSVKLNGAPIWSAAEALK